jgi:DNA-binding CsgD family transcriptional regulator/tetratricopeptide (TPR) repeat protein
MPRLLERDGELDVLRRAVVDASSGRGSIVLVAGEAGIGKSSLVGVWSDDPGHGCRVLVGLCDDLMTQRTLGPFRDVARRVGGDLAAAVAQDGTLAVCDALLAELSHPLHPTAVVVEDAHWADEATLDVLRYVGRRIASTNGVLVVTFREEETGSSHDLQSVLGVFVGGTVHRMRLRPLSRAAVRELAGDRVTDLDRVVWLTGGNPLFVNEIVSARGALPPSISDSVQGRLQSLPQEVRAAVELLSVIPHPVALTVATSLTREPSVLAQAEARGLLDVDGDMVRFRHELTRVSIVERLTSTERQRHHATVLEVLQQHDADEAELLHHAVLAGRPELVVRYGIPAARRAYRAGAHRQAAVHQRHVLHQEERLEPSMLAELLEEHAWSQYNLHRFDQAIRAAERAERLRGELDDRTAHVRSLCTLSRMQYVHNEPRDALASAGRAVALAEELGELEPLTEARVVRSGMHVLLDRKSRARPEAARALDDARSLGRKDLESLALNYLAACGPAEGEPQGVVAQRFRDAIEIALAGNHLEAAARAYTNLVSELANRAHPDAWQVFDEAVAFTTDHDFASYRFSILAQGANLLIATGRWDEAQRLLDELRTAQEPGLLEVIVLEGQARLAVRRGHRQAETAVETAWELATQSEAAQYVGPIAALRAERAFLQGDTVEAALLVEYAIDDGEGLVSHSRGELLAYLQRAGVSVSEPHGEVPEAWQLVLSDEHARAAEEWERIGDPYERAMSLGDLGTEESLIEAITILDRLGAVPAARIMRRRLRGLGARSIPRGPQPETRGNPAGLTPRQLQVAELVAEGLTNAEIADRLVVSVRTVDHHVAAVLQKLEVAGRDRVGAALTATRDES